MRDSSFQVETGETIAVPAPWCPARRPRRQRDCARTTSQDGTGDRHAARPRLRTSTGRPSQASIHLVSASTTTATHRLAQLLKSPDPPEIFPGQLRDSGGTTLST